MWGIKVVLCGLMLAYSIPSMSMIYGRDDRKPISAVYAKRVGYSPVVYLFIKKSNSPIQTSCSGAWISKTHILTARHCVANAQKILIINQYESYTGSSRAIGKKFYVDKSSSQNQAKWMGSIGAYDQGRANAMDWAVIEVEDEGVGSDPEYVWNSKLGQNVKNFLKYSDGSEMGHFKIDQSESLRADVGVTLAAYHIDADNMLYREHCRYRPRDLIAQYRLMFRRGLMEIDCDAKEGASGGSVLNCNSGTCKIVGVYSGEFLSQEGDGGSFTNRYGNAVARSENFILQVNHLLKGDKTYVKSFDLVKPQCKLSTCIN